MGEEIKALLYLVDRVREWINSEPPDDFSTQQFAALLDKKEHEHRLATVRTETDPIILAELELLTPEMLRSIEND